MDAAAEFDPAEFGQRLTSSLHAARKAGVQWQGSKRDLKPSGMLQNMRRGVARKVTKQAAARRRRAASARRSAVVQVLEVDEAGKVVGHVPGGQKYPLSRPFVVASTRILTPLEREADAAVFTAAQGNFHPLVALLARKPAQVNFQRPLSDGSTGLMAAACHGDLDMVKWLLAAGGDVMLSDSLGRRALHYAADAQHAEVEALLLREEVARAAELGPVADGGFEYDVFVSSSVLGGAAPGQSAPEPAAGGDAAGRRVAVSRSMLGRWDAEEDGGDVADSEASLSFAQWLEAVHREEEAFEAGLAGAVDEGLTSDSEEEGQDYPEDDAGEAFDGSVAGTAHDGGYGYGVDAVEGDWGDADSGYAHDSEGGDTPSPEQDMDALDREDEAHQAQLRSALDALPGEPEQGRAERVLGAVEAGVGGRGAGHAGLALPPSHGIATGIHMPGRLSHSQFQSWVVDGSRAGAAGLLAPGGAARAMDANAGYVQVDEDEAPAPGSALSGGYAPSVQGPGSLPPGVAAQLRLAGLGQLPAAGGRATGQAL